MISRSNALALAAVVAAAGMACSDITRPISAPQNASHSFLANPGGDVVVSPDNMQGWSFSDERTGTSCSEPTDCGLVDGPVSAPKGRGSAELATTAAADGKALVLVDYQGMRLDHVTDLRYSTYRQSADPGANVAIALQFNADYDLTDNSVGYQGRLVYEPYQGYGGNVPDTTWQSWDAKAGKWWGTRASVSRGGVSVGNPCVQATPCTWSELLATFPNVGVHATYGAIYLKAGSGWVGFRGNVDDLTIGVDGGTTTFDFERTGVTVPTLPPTGIPAWIYSDTNFVSGGSAIAGDIARNVMVVAFEPGAPASARAAAVGRVGGSVVGGIPLDEDGDGVYYVRPGVGASPVELLDAVATVAAAPGVAMAIPIVHDSITGDYLRPRDSVAVGPWELDKLKAGGVNWALESISAPMAWGCAMGDATTRVAVVDAPFHQLTDVSPTNSPHYDAHYDTSRTHGRDAEKEHGNAVASILAAQGNNGVGSTGVMWKSDLRLLQLHQSIPSLTSLPDSVARKLDADGMLDLVVRLRSAVLDGARVINLSQGITLASGKVVPANESGTTYLERRVRPALRWVLKLRNGLPTAPLFVVSAGNGDAARVGRDAYWNGFPMMRSEFPDRIVAVAATNADGSRTQIRDDSNFGPLVEVAAPGDRVMALDQDNTIFGFYGTSAAAPLVAGVAGLLASFDPSITVREMHDAIVQGAKNGGLTASSRRGGQPIPYLNAYEALKVAAQRFGAPLCGNRVYKTGNAIVAQRGTATETIIALDSLTPDAINTEINVYHGGKRIDLYSSRAFIWQSRAAGFVEKKPYPYPGSLVAGAASRSLGGRDHDNVSGISTFSPALGPTAQEESAVRYYVDVEGVIGEEKTLLDVHIDRPTTADVVGRSPQGYDSFNGLWKDTDSAYFGNWSEPRMEGLEGSATAMAPSGDYAVVAVNFIHRATTVTAPWLECTEAAYPDFPPQQCADGTVSSHSDSVNLFRIDLRSDVPPRRIAHLVGVEIEWLALSELEDEIVWQTVVKADTSTIQYLSQTSMGVGPWYFTNIKQTRSFERSCTGRVLEYRKFDRDAEAPVGLPATDPIRVRDGCSTGSVNLAGTLAPSRVPTNQPRLDLPASGKRFRVPSRTRRGPGWIVRLP